MRGRFLEERADPRAVAALKGAFAHYDADDLWRALATTMDLFRWLAEETAARLDLAYPNEGDAAATDLVSRLRTGQTEERPPESATE